MDLHVYDLISAIGIDPEHFDNYISMIDQDAYDIQSRRYRLPTIYHTLNAIYSGNLRDLKYNLSLEPVVPDMYNKVGVYYTDINEAKAHLTGEEKVYIGLLWIANLADQYNIFKDLLYETNINRDAFLMSYIKHPELIRPNFLLLVGRLVSIDTLVSAINILNIDHPELAKILQQSM